MRTAAATLAVLFGVLIAFLLPPQGPQDAHAQGKGGGGNTRCSIDSVTSVAFGTYDTDSSTQDTSTGALRFSCQPSKTLTVQVAIGPSAVSGSISERRMQSLGGADQLRYNLFQDQRGTIVWGDGLNGGS